MKDLETTVLRLQPDTPECDWGSVSSRCVTSGREFMPLSLNVVRSVGIPEEL